MRRKQVVFASVGSALALGLAVLLSRVPALQTPFDPASPPVVVAESAPEAAHRAAHTAATRVAATTDAAVQTDAATTIAARATDDPLLRLPLAPGEALHLLEWCAELAQPDRLDYLEQQWRWLGEQAAQLERSNYTKARAAFIQRCGPWTLDRDSDRATAIRAELLERANRSVDLADRLRVLATDGSAGEADAARVTDARQLLEAALRAGRPELLRDVGRALQRSRIATPDQLGPYAGAGAATLFTLLACDLGMACGEGSEMLQLNCALRGLCGYPDYETLMFDAWHSARERELIQQHRALLLQRIRAGQIDGLFDPVPLPPKP